MKALTENRLLQLKMLSDPARLRLAALCANAECSVSELTHVLSLSQPRVSQHLKSLCDAEVLERFREGHFVFYRTPTRGDAAAIWRAVNELLLFDDAVFADDLARLCDLREIDLGEATPASEADRLLYRALVELTLSRPLGDLLDIGCGEGRVLKLLASRAKRVVGLDIDADARRLARAELLLAGAPNATLRQGDMVKLPFATGEFDTVILDDVLPRTGKTRPALAEAVRVMKPTGRLVILASTNAVSPEALNAEFAQFGSDLDLRLATPRSIPAKNPVWVMAVAEVQQPTNIAA